MTMRKRALSLLLAMIMVASLLTIPAFAEGESGASQPVWPNEGSIHLDKTAAAVEGEDNLWEVTLKIEGKNYKTTSDVVLVIDNSNSMWNTSTRMTNTKKAAKAFAQKLLTNDSSTRIAVVVYCLDGHGKSTGFYTYETLSDFNTYIDNIQKDEDYGGTNTQWGLHEADRILSSEASTGQLKNIVLLSDGMPTQSYQFTATATMTDCKVLGNFHVPGNISDIQYTGFDYKTFVGNGYENLYSFVTNNVTVTWTCGHNKTETTKITYNNAITTNHSYPTIMEASNIKDKGTTIYSIALQAGDVGAPILKSCASDEAKGYFDIGANDNVEEKLTSAFEAIAGSIAIAASQGKVTDPMGADVDLSFTGSAPVSTTDESVYSTGGAEIYISQGALTYDATTETINWNVGNINEGTPAVMKYKVKLRESYNPKPGTKILTNGRTCFEYKNYQQNDTTQDFPIPEVTVSGGTIRVHYYLVNGDGQPINENGEVVDAPRYAYQVKALVSDVYSYGTYTVSKADIDDYSYYGSYILNDDGLSKGDSVDVTLSAQNSSQDVWFAYYRPFYVAHVQNGVVVSTDTYPVQSNFNLTNKVSEGYLYGGAFNAEACDVDDVQSFANGQNALSFTPEVDATYYIWEVPNHYLAPMNYRVWRHVPEEGGLKCVTQLYLLTTVDRQEYRTVGFTMDGNEVYAEDDKGSIAYGTVKALKSGELYDYLYVMDGKLNASKTEEVAHDDGYIGLYQLDSNDFYSFKNNGMTFQPFWITLDGIKVSGLEKRQCTHNGAGNDLENEKISTNNTTNHVDMTYVEAPAAAPMMAFCATYVMNTDEESIEPDPIAPDDNEIVITVNDNGSTYDLTVEPGNVTINYAGADGMLFAGWYTDEAYTTPADFSNVQESMTVYAKYVSDAYLRVKYLTQGIFSIRGVTLISAVDDGDYLQTGFEVNGVKVNAYNSKRYGSYTAQYLFGVDRNASLIVGSYSLSNASNGDTFTICPYWITADGTTVYGTERTLTYYRSGLKG